jgi:hypothetical protein
MAKDRKRLAAALAYIDEKAKRLTSLDQPKESDAVDMALEMGGSFIPGVGQALAARDLERARRADDEAGMAMAAASALPVGRLIGALKGFDPVMREIDVYHGSPHRFEEFDASKIGTGEGAQAYGHGIYLAESPNVAQHYATGGGGFVPVQGKDNVYFNGQWVQDFSDKKSPEGLAKYAMSQSSTGTTIKEKTETLNKIGRKDAADWLEKNADKFNQSKGNLYTADLPDEMVDRMLDYDKPLKDQPAAYQAIRSMIPADVVKDFDANVEKGITGGNAYSNWVWGGKTPAGRSEKLRQSGIVGIKYADAGSRDQGGGTRNFVVFPGEEKKVKILKRE